MSNVSAITLAVLLSTAGFLLLLVAFSTLLLYFMGAAGQDLLGTIQVAGPCFVLGLAHLGAGRGLLRRREWGRLLATFSAGFWFATVILSPLAIGIVYILWHQHLPERGHHAVRRVTAALQTPHAESPAATGADGLTTNIRRWVLALMALSVLVFAMQQTWILAVDATSASDSLPLLVVEGVAISLMALLGGAAIVGVGRGQPWGGPVALFAAGTMAVTWALPLVLLVLLLVYRSKVTTRLAPAPAAALTADELAAQLQPEIDPDAPAIPAGTRSDRPAPQD